MAVHNPRISPRSRNDKCWGSKSNRPTATPAAARDTKHERALLLTEMRQHGLARIIARLDPPAVREPDKSRAAERLLAGFNAFSAPVFDHEGRMRFALTVVGSAAHFSEDWDGQIAQATKAHAQRLGYRAG